MNDGIEVDGFSVRFREGPIVVEESSEASGLSPGPAPQGA